MSLLPCSRRRAFNWRPALGSLFLLLALPAASMAADPAPFSTPWSVRAHDPAQLARDQEHLATMALLHRAGPPVTPRATIPAWVYFTDKGIASDAEFARARAAATAALAPAARNRRAVIATGELVDYLDLPVRADYLATVARTGARLRHPSRWLNAVSVDATPAELEAIADLSCVARLEPLARGVNSPLPSPTAAPEASARAESHILSYGPSLGQLEEIQAAQAHDLGYTGAGVIVCMLDTGFFKDHEAFGGIIHTGRLIAERDFIQGDWNTQNQPGDPPTQHNHGTYTWSALGGEMGGELYGPAYGAKFALAKTEDVSDEQPIEEDHWLAASEWADSLGAQVISSSLGYLDWYTYADMDGNTAVTSNAADIAASRNIVVATAAGNEGMATWHYIIAPADADSVLAVGAVNSANEIEDFSSWGPSYDGRTKPEVVARGRDTHCATTLSSSTYGDLSGTSLATPLVGGAAALVIQAHPTWSAWKVRQALIRTADTFTTPDNRRGYGRIRVVDAINVSFVGIADQPAPAVGPTLLVRPNPFAPPGTIELELTQAGSVVLAIYGADGRLVRPLTSGPAAAGQLRIAWDGKDDHGRLLPAGIYFLQARGPAFSRVTKLVIAR
jgi:serine protease AprX